MRKPAAPTDFGTPPATDMAVAAKYRVDILGPLPEQSDAPAPSTHGRSSRALKDAVDRVRAQHVAAVNAGDLEAALDIFAPDGAVMPPGQPVLQGAALRAWFTHVFANVSLRDFDVRPDAADQYGNAVIEHGSVLHRQLRHRRSG